MQLKYVVEVTQDNYYGGNLRFRLSAYNDLNEYHVENVIPLEYLQAHSIMDVVFDGLKDSLKKEVQKQFKLKEK